MNARLQRRLIAFGCCDSVQRMTPASRTKRVSASDRLLGAVGWVVFAVFVAACVAGAAR